MKNKRMLFPVLLVIIFCGLPSLYCLGSSIQLAYFFVADGQAASKFDALNQKVLEQLPPPAGVVELERRISGGHGRYLSVDYSMGQMTEEQVFSYYTDLLLSKGWRVFHPQAKGDGHYPFGHEPACLDLNIYPQMTPAPQYTVTIWYDLWSQPFSPPKPNLTLLNILEFGEMHIAQCTLSVHY